MIKTEMDKIKRRKSDILAGKAPARIEVRVQAVVQQLVDGELLFVAGRDDELQKDPEVLKQMDEFEKVAIQQVYMRRLIAKGISVVELQRIYDETIRKTEGPLEVRASHILVEDEQDATDIIKALNRGADFDKLARERSIGPSAPRGGDLGYFSPDDASLSQPVKEAIFALAEGQMSAPVKDAGRCTIRHLDRCCVARFGVSADHGESESCESLSH